MRSALFGAGGCKLAKDALGEATLAGGQIVIGEAEGGRGPWIEAISPPRITTEEILRYSGKEYERGADNFFRILQRALAADDQEAVVSMCAYPIRVEIGDRNHWMENRAELLRSYTQVFTPGVKKAVAGLRKPIHMGWRGFMTGRGELWMDSIAYTHVYRITAINGPVRMGP